jgi:methionyl-tRNA synthetase
MQDDKLGPRLPKRKEHRQQSNQRSLVLAIAVANTAMVNMSPALTRLGEAIQRIVARRQESARQQALLDQAKHEQNSEEQNAPEPQALLDQTEQKNDEEQLQNAPEPPPSSPKGP